MIILIVSATSLSCYSHYLKDRPLSEGVVTYRPMLAMGNIIFLL
jgi:hypothetical protein